MKFSVSNKIKFMEVKTFLLQFPSLEQYVFNSHNLECTEVLICWAGDGSVSTKNLIPQWKERLRL